MLWANNAEAPLAVSSPERRLVLREHPAERRRLRMHSAKDATVSDERTAQSTPTARRRHSQ